MRSLASALRLVLVLLALGAGAATVAGAEADVAPEQPPPSDLSPGGLAAEIVSCSG